MSFVNKLLLTFKESDIIFANYLNVSKISPWPKEQKFERRLHYRYVCIVLLKCFKSWSKKQFACLQVKKVKQNSLLRKI